MTYELWETTSGNLVGDFASEVEALAFVLRTAEWNSAAGLESLSLVYIGESAADSKGLAAGRALIERAERFFGLQHENTSIDIANQSHVHSALSQAIRASTRQEFSSATKAIAECPECIDHVASLRDGMLELLATLDALEEVEQKRVRGPRQSSRLNPVREASPRWVPVRAALRVLLGSAADYAVRPPLDSRARSEAGSGNVIQGKTLPDSQTKMTACRLAADDEEFRFELPPWAVGRNYQLVAISPFGTEFALAHGLVGAEPIRRSRRRTVAEATLRAGEDCTLELRITEIGSDPGKGVDDV